MNEEKIRIVSNYFNKIRVATIVLEGNLSIGDSVRLRGVTTDSPQNIDSMKLEHKNIESATAGNHIGMKVKEYTREGDIVYKVVEG